MHWIIITLYFYYTITYTPTESYIDRHLMVLDFDALSTVDSIMPTLK